MSAYSLHFLKILYRTCMRNVGMGLSDFSLGKLRYLSLNIHHSINSAFWVKPRVFFHKKYTNQIETRNGKTIFIHLVVSTIVHSVTISHRCHHYAHHHCLLSPPLFPCSSSLSHIVVVVSYRRRQRLVNVKVVRHFGWCNSFSML